MSKNLNELQRIPINFNEIPAQIPWSTMRLVTNFKVPHWIVKKSKEIRMNSRMNEFQENMNDFHEFNSIRQIIHHNNNQGNQLV